MKLKTALEISTGANWLTLDSPKPTLVCEADPRFRVVCTPHLVYLIKVTDVDQKLPGFTHYGSVQYREAVSPLHVISYLARVFHHVQLGLPAQPQTHLSSP